VTTTTLPFDLLLVRDFLDAAACARVAAGMRAAGERPAVVYGLGAAGTVDGRVRRAARVSPAAETVEFVRRRLAECMEEVGAHFGVRLTGSEEPQFLRYREGDFFVAHQDGNTGLTRLETEARRVSVVIFLSRQAEAPEPGAYTGGALVFTDWRGRHKEFRLGGEPGLLVAFRAETTHEVTPVTHGERLSIASWYV
jgi:SM-20-related protein